MICLEYNKIQNYYYTRVEMGTFLLNKLDFQNLIQSKSNKTFPEIGKTARTNGDTLQQKGNKLFIFSYKHIRVM